MSIADLQMTRAEKIYELGFLYYNKAVEGMEMMPEALDIITDIRERFGYLLYLKQNNGDLSQIQELDAQISSQFSQLGEVCYGYYKKQLNIDAGLASQCSLISTMDVQISRENDIANGLQMSAPSFSGDAAQAVPQNIPVPTQNEAASVQSANDGVRLSDSSFVMPVPSVANDTSDDEVEIKSIQIENIERSLSKKCACGHDNKYDAKFCESCGAPFVQNG